MLPTLRDLYNMACRMHALNLRNYSDSARSMQQKQQPQKLVKNLGQHEKIRQ